MSEAEVAAWMQTLTPGDTVAVHVALRLFLPAAFIRHAPVHSVYATYLMIGTEQDGLIPFGIGCGWSARGLCIRPVGFVETSDTLFCDDF